MSVLWVVSIVGYGRRGSRSHIALHVSTGRLQCERSVTPNVAEWRGRLDKFEYRSRIEAGSRPQRWLAGGARVTESFRLSKRVSGVIKFATHDDLVVSYQRVLSTGAAQLRTAQRLAPGDQVFLSIHLLSDSVSLEVPSIVDESVPADGEGGRFSTRVSLDQDATQLIEQFIMETDPSLREQRLSTAAPRGQLTIVLVDDSPAQLEHAAAPFRERGDEVIVASDGLAGLAMCLKHQPDVILSDVQMPKADGWQLLRMVRARKQLARTPFIFLTTLSSEEDRLRGYRLGVDDYLAKPYAQEVLVARVERLLRRQSGFSWPPQSQDGLRGDLEQVGLPALLSFLELERKSGVIYLEPKGSLIMLEEGRPIRAKTKNRDSVDCKADALFELLSLTRGRFEFVPGTVKEEDSIQASLSGLLMEHARITDEATRRPA